MKLKSFTPQNSSFVRTGKPTIHVSSETGAIYLNKSAKELLGLESGDQVLLHQDETNPKDWYITVEKEGFVLRAYNNDRSLVFNSAKLAKSIVDSIEADGNGTMLIGAEPVAKKYWPIITSSFNNTKNG